jgi:plastocyanin
VEDIMSNVRIATLAVIALSMGCRSNDPTSSSGECTPTATRVCMVNSLFNPASLTIPRGSSVDWVNDDPIAHTTTSNPNNPAACGTWDTELEARTSTSVATVRMLFSSNVQVTCGYYCKLHATPTSGTMRGTIVVQ